MMNSDIQNEMQPSNEEHNPEESAINQITGGMLSGLRPGKKTNLKIYFKSA